MAWVVTAVVGAALVGLGAFFTTVGLDRADKFASVLGAFVGVVGLGLAAFGVSATRRAPDQPQPDAHPDDAASAGPAPTPGGPSVVNSEVAGSVWQIDSGGDVNINGRP